MHFAVAPCTQQMSRPTTQSSLPQRSVELCWPPSPSNPASPASDLGPPGVGFAGVGGGFTSGASAEDWRSTIDAHAKTAIAIVVTATITTTLFFAGDRRVVVVLINN
jgi:hypothetical protein